MHCVHVCVYKCGDKLVGERTRTLLESWLTELCFAYDAAIMGPTKDSIVQTTVELDRVVRTCGFVKLAKSKSHQTVFYSMFTYMCM